MTTLNSFGVGKRLEFVPAENPNPRKLSQEQIAFYNERGYLKGFQIFDAKGVEANRNYFDWLLEQVNKAGDGRDAYSINGYQTQCRGLYDLVTHPLILDYVEDLVGPNFVCWGSHFFCKLPGDPKAVPWHQDASYWPFDRSGTVTVWLAIDDADLENACMQVIPGTHRLGALDWKPTQQTAVLNQEIVDAEKYGKPVAFELKAGSMSLHTDMLAHGSDPNLSNRRRCGYTIRYCPVELRSDWAAHGFVCRGSDPSGHWGNPPRPPGEDFEVKLCQKKVRAG